MFLALLLVYQDIWCLPFHVELQHCLWMCILLVTVYHLDVYLIGYTTSCFHKCIFDINLCFSPFPCWISFIIATLLACLVDWVILFVYVLFGSVSFESLFQHCVYLTNSRLPVFRHCCQAHHWLKHLSVSWNVNARMGSFVYWHLLGLQS